MYESSFVSDGVLADVENHLALQSRALQSFAVRLQECALECQQPPEASDFQ